MNVWVVLESFNDHPGPESYDDRFLSVHRYCRDAKAAAMKAIRQRVGRDFDKRQLKVTRSPGLVEYRYPGLFFADYRWHAQREKV